MELKSIIELSNLEAKTLFMKSSSYANFDLPPYFNFSKLLTKIDRVIEGKDINTFFCVDRSEKGNGGKISPKQLEGVNYKLLSNKDGKYAFRPHELIHPVLYVSLVNKITEKENWGKLTDRLKYLRKNSQISCSSLPVAWVGKDAINSNQTTTIINWWQNVEQQSLELALDFKFIISTDITSCYSNIYTHSIAWAVEGKRVAKSDRGLELLGNYIDHSIQQMSYGQTNGIPQGSVLMDFIAELVLHYADDKLSTKIKDESDYYIIRYRDDYRILSKEISTAEKIMKELTEVLSSLGLSINTSKTNSSADIIRSSVKEDKLFWIKQVHERENIQHYLFLINDLSHQFPNSGQLVVALTEFKKKIDDTKNEIRNAVALISVVVDIACRNPKVYALCIGIVSVFLDKLDGDKQYEIVVKITEKFNSIPNTGNILLWLQRLSIRFNKKIDFEETLCHKVEDNSVKVWNSNWLSRRLREFTDETKIIDPYLIKSLSKIIDVKEIKSVSYDMGEHLIEEILPEPHPVPDFLEDMIPEPHPVPDFLEDMIPEPHPFPDDIEEVLPDPIPDFLDDDIPDPFPDFLE